MRSVHVDIRFLKALAATLIVLLNCFSVYSQSLRGKVISIKDGDTIEILYDGQPLKIRFYGIDCPEKKQDFGSRATAFTSASCFGKVVAVIPHGKDKYRRLLGEVILPDGQNLNRLLVKNGYAWRYKYSKDPLLGKLQEEAQHYKRGLWAMPAPEAPWAFRARNKRKNNIKK